MFWIPKFGFQTIADLELKISNLKILQIGYDQQPRVWSHLDLLGSLGLLAFEDLFQIWRH